MEIPIQCLGCYVKEKKNIEFKSNKIIVYELSSYKKLPNELSDLIIEYLSFKVYKKVDPACYCIDYIL